MSSQKRSIGTFSAFWPKVPPASPQERTMSWLPFRQFHDIELLGHLADKDSFKTRTQAISHLFQRLPGGG